MSDIIRFIAKQFATESPKMTRRDFLRKASGAAAAAAVPKWLGNTVAPAEAAKAVQFVEDPKILSGFTGLSTYGTSPYDKTPFFWTEDLPDMDEMSGQEARGWIKRNLGLNPAEPHKLPWSLSQGVPEWRALDDVDPDGRVGRYAWNTHTRQWHPVVAFKGDNPNLTSLRYLEPGSAVPDNALDFGEYWVDNASRPDWGDEFYKTPGEFAGGLMDEWRKAQVWKYKKDGPNKDELARDPELRDQYVKSAQKSGLAPGGRYEQGPDLAPRSPHGREFDLPLDMSVLPDEPMVNRSNFRRQGPWAPALLAPVAASQEEKP